MLNYTDFLIETYDVQHTAKSKEAFLMACAVKGGASLEESESLMFFINEGFVDDLFETCLSINEESFADKFKALADAAKEKIKEKGKEYADKRRVLYKKRHQKDITLKDSNGFYANKLLW